MGLFDFLRGKKRLTPQEQEFIRKRQRVLAKSLDAMLHTDDIEKYFSNYRNAETIIKEIASIAGYDTPCIAGETPADCLESIQRDNIEPTKALIDRYIRKETVRIMGLSRGRAKAAAGVASIIELYEQDMAPECVEYADKAINSMMARIKKLEEE